MTYTYVLAFSFSFINFLIFILREKGREGERVGEKHQCVVAFHTPPTGDPAYNPGMCPDWESNWQPFGSQASAQSTEPHQPGLFYFLCHIMREHSWFFLCSVSHDIGQRPPVLHLRAGLQCVKGSPSFPGCGVYSACPSCAAEWGCRQQLACASSAQV